MNIKLNPGYCKSCLVCTMVCSLQFEGKINPAKARTRIIRSDETVSAITFTADCTYCGRCAKYCYYGARVVD